MPPALNLVQAAEPPLSPARQRLSDAIEDVRVAVAAQAEAARPEAALRVVIDAATAAQHRVDLLRDEREQALGEWFAAGSVGERPTPSFDEGIAERAAALKRADAVAAERALPAVVARRQAADQVVSAAAGRQADSVVEAALEAAGEVVDHELAPAIETVLRIEARLEGLRHALLEAGNRSSPAPIRIAGALADKLREMIVTAKRSPSAERADAGGRAFLDRLASDSGAKL